MWWSEERIRWYERASNATGFHRALADVLEEHITKEESILELGCGLGYVSALLAMDGYAIKATDIDKRAIEEARRIHKLDIFSTLDAEKVEDEADVILLLYFGRISENDNLHHYLSHAHKRLIAVISEHRGQSKELRKNSEEPAKTENHLKRFDALRWERIAFNASFDQPLSSYDDAAAYIETMYGRERMAEYMRYVRNEDGRLYLPNEKHSSIFIIDKGGIAQ